MAGQAEEGIGEIRRGLSLSQSTNKRPVLPYFLFLLASAYQKAEQQNDAFTTVREAQELVATTAQYAYTPFLLLLKGELLLTQEVKVENKKSENVDTSYQILASHGEAESCFLKAIAIARQQQAKSLELRAVMSLVRLRQQQVTRSVTRHTQHESRERLGEAHRMLVELYGWFTEGFETADLCEARALLNELAE